MLETIVVAIGMPIAAVLIYAAAKPDNFQGVTLSLGVSDAAQAQKYFSALSQGGTVNMPLEKTFYASFFGMVSDRFGVPWMVIAP